MNTYILIVAWASMVISILAALLTPLLIGKPREPLNYASFVSNLLAAVFVTSLALYAIFHA